MKLDPTQQVFIGQNSFEFHCLKKLVLPYNKESSHLNLINK